MECMPQKLLLADDSVTIQRVIELTFADEDVQVVAVGNGRDAIERVQRDRPDIVLADIGMPERNGYEVAAFVKGNPATAHIPVVLLTGAFEPIDEFAQPDDAVVRAQPSHLSFEGVRRHVDAGVADAVRRHHPDPHAGGELRLLRLQPEHLVVLELQEPDALDRGDIVIGEDGGTLGKNIVEPRSGPEFAKVNVLQELVDALEADEDFE